MGQANNYLNQIPGVAHEGYDPYINAGKDASGKTKSAYEGMMDDPTGFINKLMQDYKPSEGYQFAEGKLKDFMGGNAASGGFAGSSYDTNQQAGEIQGLLSKDMQQFLENALGRYDTGLKGEEGVASRGYDATGKLTDTLGNVLGSQAGGAFQDAQQQNKNSTDKWSQLVKLLGAVGGGVAGSVFGPVGTAAGTALAGKLFPGG